MIIIRILGGVIGLSLFPVGFIAALGAEDAKTDPPKSVEPAKTALLAVGVITPDFSAKDVSGKEVRLSDFKGKVVVLDFWATWCGPCQASLPHTESVARDYKDKNVVVLASCTSDTRKNFDKWMVKNQSKYADIVFTFDPAERGENRLSKALYGVLGIPTQFVVGADGVIKDVIVGYDQGDLNLEIGLSKAGVPVDAATLAKAEQARRMLAGKRAKAEAERAKAEEEARTLYPNAEFPVRGPDIYDIHADAAAQLADGMEKANSENKRVLAVFGGNGIVWCRQLHDLMKTDPAIAAFLGDNYVLVMVDVIGRDTTGASVRRNEQVFAKYGGAGIRYPALSVLTGAGFPLVVIHSAALLTQGSHPDPAKLMAFLKASAHDRAGGF